MLGPNPASPRGKVRQERTTDSIQKLQLPITFELAGKAAMNQDAQRRKRRRGAADEGEGDEQRTQAGRWDGRGGSEQARAADTDDEELSGDDASLSASDSVACEMDDRTLEDDLMDEETGQQPQPVDDAGQAEYVNSLVLPRAVPASRTTSQEPGNGK